MGTVIVLGQCVKCARPCKPGFDLCSDECMVEFVKDLQAEMLGIDREALTDAEVE